MSFLQTLAASPVEQLGLVLVFVACALVVLDLAVTNHGIPAAGGMVALVLGGLLLFGVAVAHPLASLGVIAVAVALTGASFAAVSSGRLEIFEAPARSGPEAMIGEAGVVKETVGAESPGWVLVHGERWQAGLAVAPEDAHEHRSALKAGSRVLVVGFGEGKVLVAPAGEEEAPLPARRGSGRSR